MVSIAFKPPIKYEYTHVLQLTHLYQSKYMYWTRISKVYSISRQLSPIYKTHNLRNYAEISWRNNWLCIAF